MNTKSVVTVSTAIEAATSLALIGSPELVARVLLGAKLASSGAAVARVAGFGLLSLAIACWPGNNNPTPKVVRALLVYNLLAGVYLGFLRVGGGFVSFLLWPASVLHIVLAVMLARPAFETSTSAAANQDS